MTPQDLFKKATLDLEDMVSDIVVRHFERPTNGQANFYSLDIHNDLSVIEQRHRKFGRCWTFHMDDEKLKLGIYYIKIDL